MKSICNAELAVPGVHQVKFLTATGWKSVDMSTFVIRSFDKSYIFIVLRNIICRDYLISFIEPNDGKHFETRGVLDILKLPFMII